jgi:hypothetical protein
MSSDSLKNHLTENTVAFISILCAAYLMTLFGKFDIEVGSYMYLPLGAKILMYLLFGFTVLPGIIFACFISGVILFNSWNDHLFIGTLAACAGAVAPIIVMLAMRAMRTCNFSNLKVIDFKNILALIIASSVVSAMLKFFIYMQSITLNIDALDFITHYIVGDVIGSLIVIYLTLKIIVPLLAFSFHSVRS